MFPIFSHKKQTQKITFVQHTAGHGIAYRPEYDSEDLMGKLECLDTNTCPQFMTIQFITISLGQTLKYSLTLKLKS